MDFLIIGGTQFLGKHIALAAVERGHRVTLFNRGNNKVEELSELEHLVGDRLEDMSALDGRRFDRVIDTCGYHKRAVRLSGEKLKDQCDHYTFISSISVYEEPPVEGVNEGGALSPLEDDSVEEITAETYGGLKVVCERTLDELIPGRVHHVRAGLLVGPDDYTDRFTYWPNRIAEGGRVLAPGNPNQPIQFIDVRDISAWVIKAAEDKVVGPFNATGPAEESLTTSACLTICREVTGTGAELVWLSEEFLLGEEVVPFRDLPLWVASDRVGIMRTDVSGAVALGLKTRPTAETVRDTLAWASGREGHEMKVGIDRAREKELLDAWQKKVGEENA